MPAVPAPTRALLRLAPVIFAVVAVAASGWFEIADPDVWWHIAIGRWLVEQGPMPLRDPFSHSSTGPFNYYEPIADVFFYAAHAVGGTAGILVGKLALVAAVAAVVARLAWPCGSPVVAATIVLLFGAASHQQLLERAYLFSFLFFGAFFLLARRIEGGASLRWIAAFPIGIAVWSNVHRSTVLGLALFGICALALWRDPTRRREATVPLLVGGAACVVALMLNPAGAYGLTSAFAHLLGQQVDLSSIEEWAISTPSRVLADAPAVVVIAALWLFDRARRRRLDVEALVFAFAVVLAHRARFLPFIAIAASPGAARALLALVEAPRTRVGPRVAAMVVTLCAAVGLGVQYAADIPAYARSARIADRVPVDLAEFLDADPPPGRMLNSFDFGGYLVFRVAPRIPVFIDGRVGDEHFTGAFLAETLRAMHDEATLREQLRRFDIGFAVVVLGEGGPLPYAALHRDPGWALVYWDDVGAVLVKRTPQSIEYLARHAYPELRVDTAAARIAALATDPRRAALMADLDRNVADAPRSVRARYLRAQAWRVIGDPRYAAERDVVGAMAAAKGLDVPPP